MGACQSSQDGDEEEKKKRSRMIDAKLLEDERRLKKECKILLLGTKELLLDLAFLLTSNRFGREWQVNDCKADEDYSPKWIYKRRASAIPANNI